MAAGQDAERIAGINGSAIPDDLVIPFRTVRSGVAGRLVRLGKSVDRILQRHSYPAAVGQALGEALALTALLGTGLKIEGRLILQTKSDGALGLVVVNYDTPGHLRGYASFDAERTAEISNGNGVVDPEALYGTGHLAMTIDPGGDMDRYQGIVALEGQPLTDAALTYFRQSEQLPTFLRLAVARVYVPGENEGADDWHWRAGGLLLQNLAREGGQGLDENFSESEAEPYGEALPLEDDDDDGWQRTRILAATVEDHELIDPMLAPDRLLYRLFHEEGVRVHDAHAIEERCRCSRERVESFLRRFEGAQLDEMREPDGAISVTCEFCSTTYRFEPGEIG
ncbi:Hsp33 family molecular chaperone [Filomicrobium sp.]|uniref:Hsp33 family molecular chaperone n=1 Tax=Filomicrobium sp. TaxID=2024831 RepID=UPI00258EE14C|nr:Hsp33 family molecular chaperone [Filomicrobium sp.]